MATNRRLFAVAVPVTLAGLLAGGLVAAASPAAAVSALGTAAVIAGEGYGDGQPALRARLWAGNVGAGVDSSGRTLVADDDSSSVRRVETDGVSTCVAGCAHQPGFLGDDGPATAARLSGPSAVAGLPDGGFLVLDAGNHRIRKVSAAGVITTVAGNGDDEGWTDSGSATTIPINPSMLTTSPSGDAYFVDRVAGAGPAFHVVRKLSGSTLSTVAGKQFNANLGRAWLEEYEGAQATTIALDEVHGLAARASGFVFSDESMRVVAVAANGVATTVANAAGGSLHSVGDEDISDGTALDAFIYPAHLAVGADGRVTVASAFGALYRFTIGGAITRLHESLPVRSLATRADGSVIAAGSCSSVGFCVQHVTESGTVTPVFAATGNQVGDGGPATGAAFIEVTDTAELADGRLLIADGPGGRIRVIGDDGAVSTFAGTTARAEEFSGEGGSPLAAALPWPTRLAVGPAGEVYVAFKDSTVRRISNGVITTVLGDGVGWWPGGTAPSKGPIAGTSMPLRPDIGYLGVAPDGSLWVQDGPPGQQGRAVKLVDGTATQITGGGGPYFSGEEAVGRSTTELYDLSSLAIDPSGTLGLRDWQGFLYRAGTDGVIDSVSTVGGGYVLDYAADGRRLSIGSLGSLDRHNADGSSDHLLDGDFYAAHTVGATRLVYADLGKVGPSIYARALTTVQRPSAPTVQFVRTDPYYNAYVKVTSAKPVGGGFRAVIKKGIDATIAGAEDGFSLDYYPGDGPNTFKVFNPEDSIGLGDGFTLAVFAVQGGGTLSEPTVVRDRLNPPPSPTTCTVTVSKAVTYGTAVTVQARRLAGSAAVSGTSGTWRVVPYGQTAKTVAAAVTDSTGRTSLKVTPARATTYTYTAPATPTRAACSAVAKVTVRPKLAVSLSATSVKRTKAASVAVTFAPRTAGQRVTVQRWNGRGWTNVTTKATAANGRVFIGLSTRTKGTFTYRVSTPTTAAFLAATSTSVKLKVR